MFLLNQGVSELRITKIKDTELKWFMNDFYLAPDIVESYTDGAIDERVTPVYNYLSLYTGYRPATPEQVMIKSHQSQYSFNIDGHWNAIVCLDHECPKSIKFYERIEIDPTEEDPSKLTSQYNLGELLHERTIEYNRIFIYNSRLLHLETDMSLYQVFHFRNQNE